MLKVGASEAGARSAASHTGALAGDQRVFRALVEEAGAAWAEDFHDLLELAKALAEPRARPRGDGGLAVLTCSGGDSGVAADLAEPTRARAAGARPADRERLAELLPDAATIANPLDYTSMIWGDTPLLAEIVATVGADPAIDQLLLLYDEPASRRRSWAAVRDGLAEARGRAQQPRSSPRRCRTCSASASALELGEGRAPGDRRAAVRAGVRRALRSPGGEPGGCGRSRALAGTRGGGAGRLAGREAIRSSSCGSAGSLWSTERRSARTDDCVAAAERSVFRWR